MASENDQGTFENTAQRTWLTNEGLYAINGGESCESNTATDCNGGLTQTAAQRFTYLNLEYHPLVKVIINSLYFIFLFYGTFFLNR